MNQGSYDLRRDVDRLKNKTDELAKDYYIEVNSTIVTYKGEVYTPSTIVATAYQSSREITDFYDDGILDLWVSTNGGNSYTYVKQTTSHTISAVINDTTITNYRINLYDEELNLLDRQTITIVRTTKGSAGQGYDFIYYTTEKESLSQSDYPSGDITKLVGNFNEWLQSPKAIDTLHPNVFMSYRTSDDEGDWGNWSTPVKYNARGERGEDGEGLEMIFCRTQYADDYSLDPSTLNPVQTDDYVPNGWTDDQKGVSSTYCFEYVCMRTKEVPTGSKEAQWGKFSPPKLWATFSEDGKDGKGIELIFARNNDPTTAPSFRGSGNQRQDKKTYSGTDPNGKHFSDDDYVPYDWTDDQTGVDVNNQCEWVAKRIKKVTNGVASWESFNAPQLWATFSEDGEDGKDAITVMLGNEAQLIAVNGNGTLKSNPTVITIPVYCYKGISRTAGTISLSSVSNTFSTKTITRQPTASVDGLITLQCTSVPSQITKDEPISITVDGKTYTKYFTWSKIGDGKDGNDGGTFDFVYYTKNDGTVPTISSSTVIDANTGRNVVGKWCARPTNVSSSYQYCFGAYRELDYKGDATGNYSDVYIWAKYGVNGSSGTSHEYAYYTTSSATAPTKPSGNVTETTGTEKWTTVPVSMTPKKKYMYISYRINGGTWSNTALWSQFGQGITAVENQYASSTSSTTAPTSGWNTNINSITFDSTNKYVWNKEVVKSGNTVVSQTTPRVIAEYGKGGTSISSITEQYALTTNTNAPSESAWKNTVQTVTATNKYLWNREKITYSNPTSVQTTTGKIIGVYGDKGDTGAKGDKGDTGARGRDGVGLEHIFYLTNTEVTDWSQVTTNKNPQRWAVQADTDDYVMSGTGWTDDATGVDGTHKFEYCSIRTKTPNSSGVGKWGAFGEPSLWAKFSVDGERGEDGEGLEMIFCRTTTLNGYSSDPSTLPANQTPDYVPSGWTDDQTGVDENNQYEYVCMRTKIPNPNDNTGKSLIWDKFSAPKLWAKWGERGKDGITPTTDGVLAEVIQEIDPENLDAKLLGGLTADEYIEKEPDFQLLTQTNNSTGIIECRKLGFLVIINVINWIVKKNTTEGWQWLRKDANNTSTTHSYTQDIYVPSGYRPSNDLIVGGANTSGSNLNDMALRLDNDGRLRIKTNAMTNQENISGTFVFFVDSRTATLLTNNTASTLYCGDSLEATLTNSSSGTVLAGKTVTFTINNKNYPRTTDSNGKAKLSLNLNPGSYSYSVLFGGDNSYKPATSIIVANKTLNKVPSNQVQLSSTTPSTVYRTTPFTGYLKNNNSNPISGVTVSVQIGGNTSFTGKTNSDGYYKIYHPNDNTAYNNAGHNVSISVSNNAKTEAKSITISPTFKP